MTGRRLNDANRIWFPAHSVGNYAATAFS